MKMFKMMAASMLGVALCLGFTACSDDDENENGEGGENTATVVNPSQVFTGGLPKSVSGMAISHNDVTELNLQLNSDGYVEFCNSIDHAGTPDADEFTWEMEYDTEGHLVVMKRSESDGEITNITYKDGDVVKTSTRYVASGDLNGDGIIDSNDEWEYSAAIDYTTDNITAPIENKGCLMLFDEILDVDMDEMIYAYYGGMLGKATKHLPLVGHYTYNGEDSVSDMYFTWTLNSDSYPTELVVKDQWDEYRCTFTW